MSLADRPILSAEPDSRVESPAVLPRWLWAIAGGVGLALAALGGVLTMLPFFLPIVFGVGGVIGAAYGLVAVTLGGALVMGSIKGWRQEPLRGFYSRRAWGVFLLASVAVAAVAMVLPGDLQNDALFAPFHFALILLPGLFLLSLMTLLAGPAAAISARRLTLAAAGGAASVLLAIPLEVFGLFLSGVVGVATVWLIPGGAVEVERLVSLLQGWSTRPPTDELEILSLLTSPVILLVLAILLGVITPLVEEFGKTLILGVMGIWIKPTTLVSFICGVACGLGFAWIEGVSNGALGLGERVGWLGGVGVRFFATAMHALTSGLLGVGWAYLWRGKWWGLLLSYSVAVVFHGLWNLNVVMSLGGVGLTVSSPVLGGLLAVLGVGFQLLLIAICLFSLVAIPLVLRRGEAGTAPRA
jgi:hypothetical protein